MAVLCPFLSVYTQGQYLGDWLALRKIIWLIGDKERLLDWLTPTRKHRERWFIRGKEVIDWRLAKER